MEPFQGKLRVKNSNCKTVLMHAALHERKKGMEGKRHQSAHLYRSNIARRTEALRGLLPREHTWAKRE